MSFKHCHFKGAACNQERKLNLTMMAVYADPNYDMVWQEQWTQDEGRTTVYQMYTFVERIINELVVQRPGWSHFWDVEAWTR